MRRRREGDLVKVYAAPKTVDKLYPGLYRLFWVTGGSSLAAVGINRQGDRWFAPVNWVSVSEESDWSEVEFAVLIEEAK